jgi:hypothetical protein
MFFATVCKGKLKLDEPIPKSWEGTTVRILPLSPDDPIPDLEQRLEAFHKLGPTKFEPGEREMIEAELRKLDEISKDDVNRSLKPRGKKPARRIRSK